MERPNVLPALAPLLMLLLKKPTGDPPNHRHNKKALLLVRFPADFLRKLIPFPDRAAAVDPTGVTQQCANCRQLPATDRQKLSVGAAGRKNRNSNNSELVVRNRYNPNLDYKMVCGAVADRHDHHTVGVMIVTSLLVAREREQGTLDQLLVSPLTTLRQIHRQSRTGVNCRHLPASHHCAGDWYPA